MKKYLTILLLLAIALLSSCNLDNQGIFAEVIDRVPSDNRKLSFIGANSVTNIVYFKSVNGIESYDLNNGTYKTIDSSIEAKKSNRFIIYDNNTIIYFVETANDNSAKYEGYYSLNLTTGDKTPLDGSSNTDIFCSSFNNWLLTKDGEIIIPSIDSNNKLIWTNKISAPANTHLYGNIDDIIIYSTDITNSIPSTSSLVYYLFDGSNLKKINTGDTNEYGTLVSVSSNGSSKYLFFTNKDNSTTSVYELVNADSPLSKLPTKLSYTSKKFLSFIDKDSDNLYFAYDGSSIFNTIDLKSVNKELTSTTISKLGNVAIVGYFKVGTDYKICTANNGFLTLSLDGTPHLI